MASYPIANPTEAPTTGGVNLDLAAPALADVVAPESGEIVYVGDGTEVPFNTYAPGVIVLWGTRSKVMHVLGWLDRATIDSLRGAGVWGWTGGRVPYTLDAITPDFVDSANDYLRDLMGKPTTYPRPAVTEGQRLGQVGRTRGALRWSLWNTAAGGPQSPLVWLDLNGLAKPKPPPKKPPTAPAGGAGDLVLLALLALAAGEL